MQQQTEDATHRSSPGRVSAQPILALSNVSFSAGTDKVILHNITTQIFPGDFVVILGGNGSGKSSLLKLINRSYQHTYGDIIFKNKSITAYNNTELKKEMVTITQFISDSIFMDLTVEENAKLIVEKKPDVIFDLSHYLSQFNPNLPRALKTKVKNLSGGEQQILTFALYLQHQPSILLLDEHTSALDPKKADHVMAFTHHYIQQHKITCLMTTHQLDYAMKYGNRLMAIREGKLAFEANSHEKSTLKLTDLLQHCY